MTTEQYQKEMAKNIEQNTLGPNDTFRFTCKECGACCRNRTTPIMLTGLDREAWLSTSSATAP